MLKILVVEDDFNLNELITKKLANNGYTVVSAFSANKAIEILSNQTVNLMLTDLMMSGISGQELIKIVRRDYPLMPIIVATALGEFTDKQNCYKSGADDYVVKPINFDELQLRIEALLRRSNLAHKQQLDYQNLHLDFTTKTVLVDHRNIELTKKEFMILFMLVSHPNQIYSRDEILNEIWESNTAASDRTIDVHITNLREKLKNANIKIQNVRGLGYKAA